MSTLVQGPSWTREEFPEGLVFRRRHTYAGKEEDKGTGYERGSRRNRKPSIQADSGVRFPYLLGKLHSPCYLSAFFSVKRNIIA